jgi:signal peptidase I, bacterial type
VEKRIIKEVIDWGLHIGIAVLLAVLVVTFLGRITVVEGTSMTPTLHNNDVLIIESITPRFGTLHQGDIVVLRIPELLGNNRKYAVKRIIAVENQHVLIKDGKVYVDGKELSEPYINGSYTDEMNDLYSDITVPEGCIYVLGDNRLPGKSHDSRVFGPVNKERVVGRCFVRIFPFSDFGSV